MAKVKITGHASGSGIVTVTAPDTDVDRTITLPDSTGTILDENSSLPAANLTGTVADARISTLTSSKLSGALPAISGTSLTALNATNLGSGTVATARLGTGSASSSTFLRGDGAWQTAGASTLAALTDATVSASDPAVDTNPSSGVGHLWVQSTTGESYICTTATTDSNVWVNIGSGTGNITPALTVDYLVIAGGGGAGSRWHGGGAGAGGYRNSYNSEASGGGGSSETALTLTDGTVYTITVGAGGAGGSGVGGASGGNRDGTSGSDSSISGSDITDVTSTGGGYGGGYPNDGATGGSGGGGGGASGTAPSGAGTANQGYAGGANNKAGDGSGGGGGGASEVGESTTNAYSPGPGGDGGDGLASSITGASVTRGGGGGGGSAAPAGAGGAGGGGQAGNGTANTGGGGGAPAATDGNGGTGGSGVVILRMATSVYSGTSSGSPTVTTDGSDTILVFNSSGSYTA